MQILPVLDVMNGVVVHGVAGRREEYRPVVSRLTASADPRAVAGAFRSRFGFETLYLADLDAIAGRPPALPLYRDLHAQGFRLWVDAGMRETNDAAPLVDARVHSIVAGLETLSSPAALAELLAAYGAEHIVFSLDLKSGQPLGNMAAWEGPSRGMNEVNPAGTIAEQAIALGVRRLLVLDLAHVGVGQGLGTEPLCRMLRAKFPTLEITAGGGVRGTADLERLHDVGIDFALVASALHDGRIV